MAVLPYTERWRVRSPVRVCIGGNPPMFLSRQHFSLSQINKTYPRVKIKQKRKSFQSQSAPNHPLQAERGWKQLSLWCLLTYRPCICYGYWAHFMPGMREHQGSKGKLRKQLVHSLFHSFTTISTTSHFLSTYYMSDSALGAVRYLQRAPAHQELPTWRIHKL